MLAFLDHLKPQIFFDIERPFSKTLDPSLSLSTKSCWVSPSSEKAFLLPTLSTLGLPDTKPSKTDTQAKIQTAYVKNYPRQFQIRFFARINGYNQFHNILRLFDVLPNFPFITSEKMGDYYL